MKTQRGSTLRQRRRERELLPLASHDPSGCIRSRSGISLVEVVVAMPIILVAAGLMLSTITAASRQRTINAENARAAEAIRAIFENMRNEDFRAVVRLFDADPLNDPGGPGTAPGNRLTIPGLPPLADAPDDRCGEVFLPLVDAAPVGSVLPDWEVREDVENQALGTPRDLSGDNSVDAADHSADYEILPVMIEARWQGLFGPRTYRAFTLLTGYRY